MIIKIKTINKNFNVKYNLEMIKIRNKKILNEILIFIAFLLLTLFLRLKCFNYRMLDWDESLYFIWAKGLFNGILPYSEAMDNKPIGIGLIYAASFLIFGSKTMFSVKMLALFFVSGSTYFLYKIGRILHPENALTGILAGVFYCIYSCFNFGVSENTEIFFIFFVILAFYLLFKNIQNLSKLNLKYYTVFFFLALCLGLAFLIKYVVIFDVISLLIILTISILLQPSIGGRKKIRIILKLFSIILLGLTLPLLFVMLVYFFKNQMYLLKDANIFTVKYASSIGLSLNTMHKALTLHLRYYNFLLYSLFFLVFIKHLDTKFRINIFYLLIWFLIILLELLFMLTHCWDHYYIQILPPLCLLSSYLLISNFETVKNKKIKVVLSLVLVCSVLISYKQAVEYINLYLSLKEKSNLEFKIINNKIIPFYNDSRTLVAEYINKNIGTGKYIFILSEDYILYDMTNSKHTSRYIMPAQLMEKPFNKIFNQRTEIEKIMKDKPEYIILPKNLNDCDYCYEMLISNKPVYELVLKYISQDYAYDKEFGGNVLYKRIKN